jgi:SAM-dependent methyltransferase
MWDERYSVDHFVYGTVPNDFLREHANQLKPGRVLCLAEGEGRNAVYLATLGFDVTAVDLSPVGLKKAKRLAQENGVEIKTIQADLNDFDIEPASWDNIISIFCHLPPSLRNNVHNAVSKGLKPGGIFLLEAYTPEQLQHGTGGPPVAEMLQSLSQLEQDFQPLEILLGHEIERDVHEGQFHNGHAAVVQLIARKKAQARGPMESTNK